MYCLPESNFKVKWKWGKVYSLKVIHERRHMDVFSCRECRESRISTDLYIKSFRLSVGFTRSS